METRVEKRPTVQRESIDHDYVRNVSFVLFLYNAFFEVHY